MIIQYTTLSHYRTSYLYCTVYGVSCTWSISLFNIHAAPLKIFLFHKSMKIASSSPVTGHKIASTGAQEADSDVTL